MSEKTKFIIEDWAGNVCFFGKTFETFDDGWDYILEHVEDEDEHGEYYVVEKGGEDEE